MNRDIANEIYAHDSESGNNVPMSVLQIHGVVKLLVEKTHAEEDSHGDTVQVETRSALAMTVLESASIYQAKASDKRLGVGPSKNTKTTVTGLHQFKNLDKVKTILAERRSKKAEAQLSDLGIRVVATVWVADKNKLKQVRY